MSIKMNAAASLEEEVHIDTVDSSDGSSSQGSEQNILAENRKELINAEMENLLASGKSTTEVEDDMWYNKAD